MPSYQDHLGNGKKKHFLSALTLVVCLVAALVIPLKRASANDIRITNLWVHPFSGGNGEVEFDLAWDNSWRSTTGPYNWDAAWVFCKIRRNGGDWQALKLSNTGHTIPQSPQALSTAMGLVDTDSAHDSSTNPAVGIFIYRTNDGFGTVTANDMRLRWSYADNGAVSTDVVEIRVLGIEMVYTPQAAFYAGDYATSNFAFRQKSTGDDDPWYISSENALTTTDTTTGDYYYPGMDLGDAPNTIFTLSADYPKGYRAFYMAKGELSQGQWIAFFNTLTGTQKPTRDITADKGDAINYRNNIRWEGSGEAILNGGTHAGVAMNFISWADLIAYLDWAGLRPMSELEYEKAGRGPLGAIAGEYAWGSTTITQATSISNDGLVSERGQVGSNCAYGWHSNVEGPLRIGSFAKGATGRESAGAGFYGALELSGNVWERPVTVGRSEGRAFQGRYHGDGILDGSGDANVTNWPGTNAVGAGFRGGVWLYVASYQLLSYRGFAAHAFTIRFNGSGGRGVRSAP